MASFADLSDSEGETPEVDLSINIKPYMFEPVKENNQPGSDTSSENETDSEGEPDSIDHVDALQAANGVDNWYVFNKQ